ncbi:ATP-binding protein [Nocardioides mangrovicus]|uniref:ATP-binding protein n=1 Tax=Nocardioides mangrovicus TaxID=2478913 RepID=UPI0013150274|nr:ATP-binding protein [Nocardioides mangrovicus]
MVTAPAPVALSLPFTPSSAAIARSRLQEWLTGLQASDDLVEDSRLVLSELVGNAVRHARPLDDGTVLVAWNTDDVGLDIAVTDGGAPTVPGALEVDVDETTGRGLSIVETLTDRWWLETSQSRSTVHALFSSRG